MKACLIVAVIAVLLALVACDYYVPDKVLDIAVPDSAGWSYTVRCVRRGIQGTREYTATGPFIEWGFAPPDINGDWRRSRGFVMFRLGGVSIPWDEVESCTLNYYLPDWSSAPAEIRHCWVDVPRTPPDFLYEQGWSGIVATDTSLAPGWHRVPLNEAGVGTVRDYLRTGIWAIGYCWEYAGANAAGATASGHVAAERPYLTIVYPGD